MSCFSQKHQFKYPGQAMGGEWEECRLWSTEDPGKPSALGQGMGNLSFSFLLSK